ncbi:hypothetical protein L0F63_004061 [Massospora cicadina]|nr:hypothetical protein L0F63_004061 [Massospora cicadina]
MDQDELAFWRAKVTKLESSLHAALDENATYQRKLRESVEQRADLEANHSALQVEFETFKATIRATMTPNQRLQLDMERLAEKLIDETERRSELEYSKQLVEAELEDLSRNLFEEANKMVADERIKVDHLRQELSNLQQTHRQTLQLLSTYKEQCTDLKLRVVELGEQEALGRRISGSNSINTTPVARTPSTTSTQFRDSLISKSSSDTVAPTTLAFSPEDFRFLEFKEFLDAPASMGPHLNAKYMKRAMVEEVDPTLRFDSTGFFFYKRLLAAVQQATVNIHQSRPSQQTTWRNGFGIKQVEPPKCALCTAHNPTYQFTLQEGDPRNPAVHFFTYHRHSRSGLIKGSPQKLYLGSLNTQLMLFLSRTGAHNNDPINEPSPDSPLPLSLPYYLHVPSAC